VIFGNDSTFISILYSYITIIVTIVLMTTIDATVMNSHMYTNK